MMDSDNEPLIPTKQPTELTKIPFPACRHVLVFLAFLGFVNVYTLRVNLSVAIVSMVKHVERNHTTSDECPGPKHNNSHKPEEEGEFHWDANTQALVLGSFFYGYIFTQIPGGWLAEKYGGKLLFGFGVLCTSVFTLVTPFAARINVYLLVATRIIEGLGEGVTFPAMHAMLSQWAPLYERSKLGTFCYAGAQFGTVVSLPISGLLCKYLGWPSVFYFFGACGVVWFAVWMFLVYDTPILHPRITDDEKRLILGSSGHQLQKPPTAWRSIFTSLPVYAIIVAHFCNNWGFYTLLTTLPTYMREVLNFDISQNGFVSALPYLAMWIMINVGGQAADFLRFRHILSTTATRKLFNTAGLALPALWLVLVGYAGCHATLAVSMVILALASNAMVFPGFNMNHIDIAPPFAGLVVPASALVAAGYLGCEALYAVIAVTIAVGVAGLALSGYQVNHLDVAPPFAGTLMGISNMVATIPGFAGPQVVGLLTDKDPSASQWRIVFVISAGVYVFGALFFLFCASGEEQPWAKPAIDGERSHVTHVKDELSTNQDTEDESDVLSFRRETGIQH